MTRLWAVQPIPVSRWHEWTVAKPVALPHTCAMETANTGERDGPGDVPADTFAARLVLVRHFAGRLSIERAAERCGLNSGNWVRWEDGASPRDKADVAQAIADGLNIDREWLLFGGPLLSARGRPTKRSTAVTERYSQVAVRPADTRPKGRADRGVSTSSGAAGRRAVRVGRAATPIPSYAA